MQSNTIAATADSQPSRDNDEDDETDTSGPNSSENGHQNGIALAAEAQKAFNIDALAKRGKSKQCTVKKEPSTTAKQPASKKGKKVRILQLC